MPQSAACLARARVRGRTVSGIAPSLRSSSAGVRCSAKTTSGWFGGGGGGVLCRIMARYAPFDRPTETKSGSEGVGGSGSGSADSAASASGETGSGTVLVSSSHSRAPSYASGVRPLNGRPLSRASARSASAWRRDAHPVKEDMSSSK
ncbi:hypothetical protein ACFRFU_03930 [Streptomyces sp. NPDC056704]|uniref:hypothetical protein n=1 Tax=Streptomyces sp. NPDC056704 TaxID=3345917 RepID=UPI0036B07169